MTTLSPQNSLFFFLSQEGKSVILTLKDADVLGEDQDTLVNVNVMDQVTICPTSSICK